MDAPTIRANAFNCLTMSKSTAVSNEAANDKYLEARKVELEAEKVVFARARVELVVAWQRERVVREEQQRIKEEKELYTLKFGDAAKLARELAEAKEQIIQRDQEIERLKELSAVSTTSANPTRCELNLVPVEPVQGDGEVGPLFLRQCRAALEMYCVYQ